MKITPNRLAQLQAMIAAGTSDAFYDWPEWDSARSEALRTDCNECQICKARGRYRKAVIVHHVKHLKRRPDLALSIWDPDTGERQLLSVCRACHEEEHPERGLKRYAPAAQPVTVERWD